MPLIEIRNVSAHSRMGLWRMTESVEELYGIVPHCRQLMPDYQGDFRKREFLSVRALLQAMTGDETLRIEYASSGKPLLRGWHISISHTRGYAVLILSEEEEVAVDIEIRSQRVNDIASRFVRKDEAYGQTDDLLLLWSAKETIYKLFSEDNLGFFEMRMSQRGPHDIMAENMKRGEMQLVNYEFSDDYVLTWAIQGDSILRPCTTQNS